MRNVTYQPELKDYIAGYRRYCLWSVWPRWNNLGWPIFVVIIFVLGYLISPNTSVVSRIVDALYGLIAPLSIMALIMITNVLFFMPRRVKRLYKQQRNLHSETNIEWSDADIRFEAGDSSMRLRWSEIVTVLENSKVIALMPSDYMFFVIPKRVLTASQIADIRTRIDGEPGL